MYAGRVACCPLVDNDEYADGTDRQTDSRTDGRTLDRYITLSKRRGQHDKHVNLKKQHHIYTQL